MEHTIEIIIDNLYINGKFNKNENNFEITVYMIDKEITYKSIFNISNITIPNTNLEGIFTMFERALDANKQNYSIKWNFNLQEQYIDVDITFINNIFTFVQRIHFIQTDSIISEMKYKLYQTNENIDIINEQTEEFNELVSKFKDNVTNCDNNIKKCKDNIDELLSDYKYLSKDVETLFKSETEIEFLKKEVEFLKLELAELKSTTKKSNNQ